MSRHRTVSGLALAMGMLLLLAGITGLPSAARAGTEDAAIFYEELTQYGQWVDYEEYGPVWYPNQVEEDWRPYVNGRWVPTKHGYIFETEEPWGWATYHYGNWMPTETYGWVWVPGRTWYPSTVTWRNTPETAIGSAVDTAYIGWAPIPPPNYVPPPNTGWYPSGWAPGQPILNVLTAPFWIFSQAASFLLGLGQPYTPAYTYMGCGCLAPPAYYPVVYPVTRIITNWYYPTYYPPTYFVGGAIPGAYNWGPPVEYVSRVTNVNHTVINNYINNYNVTNIRNGYPPDVVFAKHRDVMPHITPPREFNKWGNPMRVQNVNAIINRNQIANPGAIAKPAVWPTFDRGRIPKAERPLLADPRGTMGPGRGSGAWEGRTYGMKGLGLSQKAIQPITPEMEKRIQTAKPIKGAETFTQMGGRGFGHGQPGMTGRGPGMGVGEGQPGIGRGGAKGPGAGFVGPGQQQGIGRGPGEGQPGIGPGRGRGPAGEGFQTPGQGRGPGGQPGLGRGPGEGQPGIGRGGAKGPGAGFVGPGQQQGVGRGPGEGQPGIGPGRGRGPAGEGFQTPGQGRGPGGQPGLGRGPGEGQPGIGRGGAKGPGAGFAGPGQQQGVGRGPGEGQPGIGPGRGRGPAGEGFQPPGQGKGPGGQPGIGPGKGRGPAGEGFQPPGQGTGQPGIRRGPTGTMPEGMPGVRRGPGEGPGIRRGPGEGQMQPPGQIKGPGGTPPGQGQPGFQRGPGAPGQPGMQRGPGGPGQPGLQRGPGGMPPGTPPGGGAPKIKQQPPMGPPPGSQSMRGPGAGGAPPQIQRGPGAGGPPQINRGSGGGAPPQVQRGPGGGGPPKQMSAPPPPQQPKGGGGGGQKQQQQQQQQRKGPFQPQ
ncbi:MAG: DUF6600 domain-containing protein [Desulfobaccales bacterium]